MDGDELWSDAKCDVRDDDGIIKIISLEQDVSKAQQRHVFDLFWRVLIG